MDPDEFEDWPQSLPSDHPISQAVRAQHEQWNRAHMASEQRTMHVRRFIVEDSDLDGLRAMFYVLSTLAEASGEDARQWASHYTGVCLAALDIRFGVSLVDGLTDEERAAELE